MKILTIDDSRFFQSFLIKLFRQYLPEAQVISAVNGAEGLALYQKERPDFILTDLLMPELDGQSLLTQIRQTDQDTKIIIISADIQRATREEVERFGITAFFNKPLNDEKAAQLIKVLKEDSHA